MVLEFTEELPPDDAALVGIRWELESLVSDDSVSSAGGNGFLTLSGDGSFAGSTGCRLLEGAWVQRGGKVTTPGLAANGQCDPDPADQDGQVVSVLESFTVAIDGDQLTVTPTGDPGQGLVYR